MTQLATTDKTTPAAEALCGPSHNDYGGCYTYWQVHAEVIREALTLLDLVQRGNVKALRQQPTENMVDVHSMDSWDGFTKECIIHDFKAMWNAAPPTPQAENPYAWFDPHGTDAGIFEDQDDAFDRFSDHTAKMVKK